MLKAGRFAGVGYAVVGMGVTVGAFVSIPCATAWVKISQANLYQFVADVPQK